MPERPVAIITGTSRDVGEYISYGLAQAGWDILGLYRNPQHDEDQAGIVGRIRADFKTRMVTLRADLIEDDTPNLIAAKLDEAFGGRAHALILNAAGGFNNPLEEAREINVYRQLRLMDSLIGNLAPNSIIVNNTSFPAHKFHMLGDQDIELMGNYQSVAQTKNEAELILRDRIPELSKRGIRLAVVVGNGLDGTFVTRILKRSNPEFVSQMLTFTEGGFFPTILDMAAAVVRVVRGNYPSGYTEYVGIKPEYQLYPSKPLGLRLFGPPPMREDSIMSREQVEAIIPHRWPFNLIGGVQEIEFGKRAVGCLVDLSHPEINWTAGHFPGYPLVPGVITQEALQQLGALTVLGLPEFKGKLALLTGVDQMQFKRPIIPGDEVRLEVEGINLREIGRRISGSGHVRALNKTNKAAVEGDISFALTSPI